MQPSLPISARKLMCQLRTNNSKADLSSKNKRLSKKGKMLYKIESTRHKSRCCKLREQEKPWRSK